MRFTASMLEKHDWQALMLSDLYFPHTYSRVDAHLLTRQKEAKMRVARLTTKKARTLTTQRHL